MGLLFLRFPRVFLKKILLLVILRVFCKKNMFSNQGNTGSNGRLYTVSGHMRCVRSISRKEKVPVTVTDNTVIDTNLLSAFLQIIRETKILFLQDGVHCRTNTVRSTDFFFS